MFYLRLWERLKVSQLNSTATTSCSQNVTRLLLQYYCRGPDFIIVGPNTLPTFPPLPVSSDPQLTFLPISLSSWSTLVPATNPSYMFVWSVSISVWSVFISVWPFSIWQCANYKQHVTQCPHQLRNITLRFYANGNYISMPYKTFFSGLPRLVRHSKHLPCVNTFKDVADFDTASVNTYQSIWIWQAVRVNFIKASKCLRKINYFTTVRSRVATTSIEWHWSERRLSV